MWPQVVEGKEEEVEEEWRVLVKALEKRKEKEKGMVWGKEGIEEEEEEEERLKRGR